MRNDLYQLFYNEYCVFTFDQTQVILIYEIAMLGSYWGRLQLLRDHFRRLQHTAHTLYQLSYLQHRLQTFREAGLDQASLARTQSEIDVRIPPAAFLSRILVLREIKRDPSEGPCEGVLHRWRVLHCVAWPTLFRPFDAAAPKHAACPDERDWRLEQYIGCCL